MNHRTRKTAAREAAAAEPRREHVLAVGQCDLGESRDTSILVCHEIVRANLRRYVLTCWPVILVVCWGTRGCHAVVERWPKAKQLALLRWRRRDTFDLEVFNRWSIARLTVADVDAHEDELVSELGHESF